MLGHFQNLESAPVFGGKYLFLVTVTLLRVERITLLAWKRKAMNIDVDGSPCKSLNGGVTGSDVGAAPALYQKQVFTTKHWRTLQILKMA